MTSQSYQQLILRGIKDLPPDSLAEIVDFIFFIRQKLFQPQQFTEALQEGQQKSTLTDRDRQFNDTAWLSLAEPSFEFWDNKEDAVYDHL